MKLRWSTRRADGRKRWGILKYLVMGVGFSLAGWWTTTRLQRLPATQNFAGPTRAAVNPAAAAVRLSGIAKSAQATQPYTEKPTKADPLARSEVGMKVGENSSKNSGPRVEPAGRGASIPPLGEDSVFAALTQEEEPALRDGRPPAMEDSLAGLTEADPDREAPPAAIPPPKALPVPPIESLLARPVAPAVLGEVKKNEASRQPTQHVMNATHWLPRGEIIPVYIMQTVQTGKFPTLVEFAVARTIWFNGKPVLPFGTRFTATAGLGVRDRITFNVDSLRRRDGLEIALGGLVLGPDQATGLPGYYIPPPTLVQLAPYIGSFFESYAGLLKLRVSRNSYQVGSFGVSVTPDPGKNEAQEIALSAASHALGDFIDSQVSDLKERYAAYLAVPAGSSAFVQLTANTDLSALWDNAPRGEARTVGEPRVMATDLLYRQRELERASQPTLAALLGQAANANAPASPPNFLAMPPKGAAIAIAPDAAVAEPALVSSR